MISVLNKLSRGGRSITALLLITLVTTTFSPSTALADKSRFCSRDGDYLFFLVGRVYDPSIPNPDFKRSLFKSMTISVEVMDEANHRGTAYVLPVNSGQTSGGYSFVYCLPARPGTDTAVYYRWDVTYISVDGIRDKQFSITRFPIRFDENGMTKAFRDLKLPTESRDHYPPDRVDPPSPPSPTINDFSAPSSAIRRGATFPVSWRASGRLENCFVQIYKTSKNTTSGTFYPANGDCNNGRIDDVRMPTSRWSNWKVRLYVRNTDGVWAEAVRTVYQDQRY